jgi:hypothetical protein
MNSQSGFTLIEALTAGTIASFIGCSILTVLYFNNGQIKEASEGIHLVRLQLVASEQIRSSARKAFGVKNGTEPGGPFIGAETYLASPTVREIRFCDSLGTIYAAYRIHDDSTFLYEMVGPPVASPVGPPPVLQWQHFHVGNDTLEINSGNSDFQILARRQAVTCYIRYRRAKGGKMYTFPKNPETFRCRNSTL